MKAALACASITTGLPIPAELPPTTWVKQAPSGEFCADSSRPDGCGALTVPLGRKAFVIMAADAPFDLRVHEMCHVLQLANGLPMSEPPCEAAQARAEECGQGAHPHGKK